MAVSPYVSPPCSQKLQLFEFSLDLPFLPMSVLVQGSPASTYSHPTCRGGLESLVTLNYLHIDADVSVNG